MAPGKESNEEELHCYNDDDDDEDEEDEEDWEHEELDEQFPSLTSPEKKRGKDYSALLEGKPFEIGVEIALQEGDSIGEKEPLLALATEYSSDNTIIQQKIKILHERYEAFRRACRDGNCFFRSFIFSYFENLIEKQDCDEVHRIVSSIEQWNLDNFSSVLTSFVKQIPEGIVINQPFTVEDLLTWSEDDYEMNEMLMFLRMVTSAEIMKKAEYYKPFIDNADHTTLLEYCASQVTPLGMEAENIHVVALSNALGVAVRIVNLDTSTLPSGTPELNQFDFIPPAYDIVNSSTSAAAQSGSTEESRASTSKSFSSDEFEVPSVTLLYRPGHYDILYPRTKNKIVAMRPKRKTPQQSGSLIVFEEDSRKKAREMPVVGEKFFRLLWHMFGSGQEIKGREQQIAFLDDYNIGEKEKIKLLHEKYGAFRRACRDGNSFYRSFIFSYMEQLVETQNIGEVTRILSCLEQWKLGCQSLEGSEKTISYLSSDLISLLREIHHGKISDDIFTVRKLFNRAQNDPEIDKALLFLRLVVCVEILKQKDYCKSFFSQTEHKILFEFCMEEVVPEGKEAGHIHATVLSNVFDVPICVETLDMSSSSSGTVGLNHFVFAPQRNGRKDSGVSTSESSILDQRKVPLVTLLYRPSHYDILYPRNRSRSNVLFWPLKQLGVLITSAEEYYRKNSTKMCTDVDKQLGSLTVSVEDHIEKSSAVMSSTGNKEPISALASDYPSESSIIREKIKLLDEKYASFRRVCGDGSCFYRSFIFSYLEQIVERQDDDEVSRLFALLEQWKLDCVSLGEDGGTVSDLSRVFASLLRKICGGRSVNEILTVGELSERSQKAVETNAVLLFLRLVTSIEIRKNEEFYRPFLGETEHKTIIDYCTEEVVQMGKDADIIHATALANAFGVPIHVVNLDTSFSSGRVGPDYVLSPRKEREDVSSVPAPGSAPTKDGSSASEESSSSMGRRQVLTVTLLYRPGQYDIIYPR